MEDFPKGRVAKERHEKGKREHRGIKKIVEQEQGVLTKDGEMGKGHGYLLG